jgi:hypothetical protein
LGCLLRESIFILEEAREIALFGTGVLRLAKGYVSSYDW